MKKALFIILCVGLLNNVFSQNKSDVVMLTQSDFLSKVYNYEKNPDKWTYEGNKPCLIDFYADWCGPCRKFAPVLAEVATQYKDKIIVYQVDIDKERELAKAFGISSIPTLLFIPSDESPQMSRGGMTKEDLREMIDKLLLKK